MSYQQCNNRRQCPPVSSYPSCGTCKPANLCMPKTSVGFGKVGPVGPTGPAGAQGTNGANGINGVGINITDGLSVGKGTPTPGTGQPSTSVVYGNGAAVQGQLGESIVIGNDAAPMGAGLASTLIGYAASGTIASGANTVGVGRTVIVDGDRSTSVGSESGVTGADSICIGYRSGNGGTPSLALSSVITIGNNIAPVDLASGDGSIYICTLPGINGGVAPGASHCIINWNRTAGAVPGPTALTTRAAGRMYIGALPVAPGTAITAPGGQSGMAYLIYDTLSGEVATSTVS